MSSLKSPVWETTTAHSMRRAKHRRRSRSAARSPASSLSQATTRRAMPVGGVKAPRPPAERRGSGGDGRHGGNDGEHRLDALPHQQRAGAGVAEADGMAVDTAERLARERHVRLRGMQGIEPRPVVDADDGAMRAALTRIEALTWIRAVLRTRVFPRTGVFPCVGGDGGDKGRQAAHAAAVAVEERGMEAQRGEAAAVDGAGLEGIPRRGCRRWRGNAATGVAPPRRGRTRRPSPLPAQPAGRGRRGLPPWRG